MSFKILNTIGDVFAQEAKSVLDQCGTADYHILTQEELQKRVADYNALLVGLGLNVDKSLSFWEKSVASFELKSETTSALPVEGPVEVTVPIPVLSPVTGTRY